MPGVSQRCRPSVEAPALSATPDPIWIDCEGSRCPTHHTRRLDIGICSMCGELVGCYEDDTAVHHKRKDIIAMIERGDYATWESYPR